MGIGFRVYDLGFRFRAQAFGFGVLLLKRWVL